MGANVLSDTLSLSIYESKPTTIITNSCSKIDNRQVIEATTITRATGVRLAQLTQTYIVPQDAYKLYANTLGVLQSRPSDVLYMFGLSVVCF